MPCVAKILLSAVLSITPGNFLALKTWKTSLKQEAKTGAEPLFRDWVVLGEPTLTKFIFRLLELSKSVDNKLTGRKRGNVLPEGTFCSDT